VNSVTAAAGQTTSYEYDLTTNTTVTNPDDGKIATVSDAYRKPLTVTDPLNHTTINGQGFRPKPPRLKAGTCRSSAGLLSGLVVVRKWRMPHCRRRILLHFVHHQLHRLLQLRIAALPD
jgi:hypothetical protein